MLKKGVVPTGQEALQWAVAYLGEKDFAYTEAYREAQLLLAKASGQEVWHLFLDLSLKLAEEVWLEYVSLVEKRGAFFPLHYLLGEKEFMSLPFQVTPAVLIPRWDTETLVEEALELLREKEEPRVLDLGTGCGAIAVSLVYYLPSIKVVATDISLPALAVARENAEKLGVASQIEFLRGNLFAPLPEEKKFTMIVANPPYLNNQEIADLPLDVRQEPILALDGGLDGLVYYRAIAAKAKDYLVPGGNLLLEVGWQQATAVKKILKDYDWGPLRVVRDLGERERVIVC